MKKLILWTLVLAIAALCACAMAEGAAVPVSDEDYELYGGTWVLVELNAPGKSMKAAELGMEMIMTLNADGTVESNGAGGNNTGTWRVEGANVIVVDNMGNEAVFTGADASLVGESGGMMMIFDREGAVSEPED